MTTPDQTIEAAIIAAGATVAPRVTLADLEANIVSHEICKHVSPSGQVLRWAILTTKSGFAVTGQPSASASPENDNQAIGEKIAIDNARSRLWELMGYELKQRLYEGASHELAQAKAHIAELEKQLKDNNEVLMRLLGGSGGATHYQE